MKQFLVAICLVILVVPSAQAAENIVDSGRSWFDGFLESLFEDFGDVISLFDGVGPDLVPTGEPEAQDQGEDETDPPPPSLMMGGDDPTMPGDGTPGA